MKKRIKHIVLIILLPIGILSAQNIHFAQFDLIPTIFNPASSAETLDRDIELGAILRDQAFTVAPQSYRSLALGGTMGFKNWSLNGNAIHDRAGVGALVSNQLFLGASYNIISNDNHLLSLGSQLGFMQRYISDFNALQFEEDLNNSGQIEFIDVANLNYFDVNAGVQYMLLNDDLPKIKLGLAMTNINSGDGVSGNLEKYKRRLTSNLHYFHHFSDRMILEPRAFYQRSENSSELSIQSKLHYATSRYLETWINGAIGWRYNDALQVMIGMEKESWKAGLAYEINTSSLRRTSNPAAAVELAFVYKFTRPKKKEPKEPPPAPKYIRLLTTVEGPEDSDSIFLKFSSRSDTLEDGLTSFPFRDTLENNKQYEIIISSPGYKSDTINFYTPSISIDTTLRKRITLVKITPPVVDPPVVEEPVVEEPMVTNPPEKEERIIYKDEPIRLEHINYDFDDTKILPDSEDELVPLRDLMIKYPDIKIELSAHTDTRGDAWYNKNLSQRRAVAAKFWLMTHGILPERIIAKGYGETQLINHCSEGVECTDDEHRENRRTEFKVIEGPEFIKQQINRK